MPWQHPAAPPIVRAATCSNGARRRTASSRRGRVAGRRHDCRRCRCRCRRCRWRCRGGQRCWRRVADEFDEQLVVQVAGGGGLAHLDVVRVVQHVDLAESCATFRIRTMLDVLNAASNTRSRTTRHATVSASTRYGGPAHACNTCSGGCLQKIRNFLCSILLHVRPAPAHLGRRCQMAPRGFWAHTRPGWWAGPRQRQPPAMLQKTMTLVIRLLGC